MKLLSFISAAVFALTSFAGAANLDLGAQSRSTPYDAYLAPVKRVLDSVDGAPGSASLDQVKRLMQVGRSFRYAYSSTNPYVPNDPAATGARRAGDCKDKALWLASQMDDSSVRFVIGKASKNSRLSHAWLYWKDSANRWWILDCTMTSAPIPADRVSANRYIPQYSFAKNAEFRHLSTGSLASVAAGQHAIAAR